MFPGEGRISTVNGRMRGYVPGYVLGGVLPGYGRNGADSSIKFPMEGRRSSGGDIKTSLGLYTRTGLNEYTLGRAGGRVKFPGGNSRRG